MDYHRSVWVAALSVAASLLVATPSSAAEAEQPLGVIELFTSQGCNSCPPADELFAEYAQGKDVVALAYHVDYWDYLGWNDTFALKENTGRQNDYMRAFGTRSVYTPQAVINGRTHVRGASRSAIASALTRLASEGEGMIVPVKAEAKGDTIVIETGAAPPNADLGAPRSAHVVLVFFDPPSPVVIERGANKGKTVTYWNAVSDIQIAGMWHNKPGRIELPRSEIEKKGGCAVLIQQTDAEGRPGSILGATVIRRAPAS